MPGLDQVRNGTRGTCLVVDEDRICRQIVDPSVHLDDDHLFLEEPREVPPVLGRGRDDQRIHMDAFEQLQVALFDLRIVVAVAEHQVVSGISGHRLHVLRDHRIEEVLQVADQEADHLGPSRAEAPSDLIRHVAEVLRGSSTLPPGLLRRVPLAGHHPGGRRRRTPRPSSPRLQPLPRSLQRVRRKSG